MDARRRRSRCLGGVCRLAVGRIGRCLGRPLADRARLRAAAIAGRPGSARWCLSPDARRQPVAAGSALSLSGRGHRIRNGSSSGSAANVAAAGLPSLLVTPTTHTQGGLGIVSELPRSARDAHASVRAFATAASPPLRDRSLTLVDQDEPTQTLESGASAPGHVTAGQVPADGRDAPSSGRPRYRDDDLLTVAVAARIARRSVRTLRRAYLSGRMVAHRDGNGRGVSIRYGDLRAWLTDAVIARKPRSATAPASARLDRRARPDSAANTGNPELLAAALQRRRRRARTSARPQATAGPGATSA